MPGMIGTDSSIIQTHVALRPTWWEVFMAAAFSIAALQGSVQTGRWSAWDLQRRARMVFFLGFCLFSCWSYTYTS